MHRVIHRYDYATREKGGGNLEMKIESISTAIGEPIRGCTVDFDHKEVLPRLALYGANPDKWVSAEYTGNEKATFERIYIRAAIIIGINAVVIISG